MVIVDVPAFTSVDGVNVACADLGNPLADSVKVPEKPWLVTVTAYVVLPHLLIVRLVGVAEMVNVPVDTTSVTVAVRVTAPLVPLIVSG